MTGSDQIRTFADCDASRFEDDIVAAWCCCQSPTNSFSRKGKPQGCRSPLNKFGIEKDVERRDLAIANNDDIQSAVVWGLAFRARAPCQNPPVVEGLWLSMRRIDEVWMCRAEVSGELVQSVVSNKDTGRDVQHAVFSIEVLNGGAAAGRVTFAKDFLKVAVQKLNYSMSASIAQTVLED
jgi:hypothetical protein